MSKYLVLIESPAKIKSYKKYLSSDYDVLATKGHVFDLPKKGIGIDIKKNFKEKMVIIENKEDFVSNLSKIISKYKIIYICTDPDREGSGIGWNIYEQILKNKNDIIIKRAKTNSITKEGISKAISEAIDIENDFSFVESYLTRRILDRLVGYKCSFITQTATGGKSAGRVQSAALRALCDREKEILNFKPEEYWDISADAINSKNDKFGVKLTKPDKMEVKNEEIANNIVKNISNSIGVISKYESKEVNSSPYAPFTTSSIQQSAATILGWSQDKTMSIAQELYESGAISYHRTDSPYIEPASISAIRTEIDQRYGKKYLPDKQNYYSPKSQNAQEAHEAIRPTQMNLEQFNDLQEDHKKLYNLIWKRTIASQMSKSVSMSVSVRITVKEYELGASGSSLVFDGWKKVWNYSLSEDSILPVMSVGEKCKIENVEAKQKFTQPPSRYTKSSITKLYEDTGIGRPSTYASITKTLIARGYINLEKNAYHVTDLGMKVSDFLVKSDFCFVDLNFTSNLEEKLDKIANKEISKLDTLNEFWTRLQSDLTKASSVKQVASQTDIPCPKCGLMLVIKHGKFGDFFACPDNKEKKCDFTANIGEDGKPKQKAPKEYADFSCDKCGGKMVKRSSKMGDFFGCAGYPKCKSMKDVNGNPIESKTSDVKKPYNKFKKWNKKK